MTEVNWNIQGYDPLKPVAQGNAYAQQILDQSAQSQAGQQYAAGDFAGASNTIGARGDFKTAEALRGIPQQRANAVSDQKIKQATAQHDYLKQAVPLLGAIYQKAGPTSLNDAFQKMIPGIKSLGTDDATIGQITQAFQTNPEGTLKALGGVAQSVPHQVGKDLVFTDPVTNQEVSRIKGGQDAPSGFETAPGGGLQPIKGGPGDPAYISANKQNARDIVVTTPTPQANQGAFRQLKPEEIQAMGYKPGTRAQINDRTGQINVTQAPNENDLKNAGYANRVSKASARLDSLAKQGITKPSTQILISEANGVTRLLLSNQKDRQFVQASKEWLAPILRKDTGAAVTDSEFAYYSDIYIPRLEDGPEVLAQKAAARADAEATLNAESGPARTDMFGKTPPPSPQQSGAPASGGKFLGFE